MNLLDDEMRQACALALNVIPANLSPNHIAAFAAGYRMGLERERIEDIAARAESAEAECARLRQDAERYRWLREPRDIFEGAAAYVGGSLANLDTLDAAIDRAIAEGKHEA